MNKAPSMAKCICHTRKTTWCGRALTASEWAFTDLSHAERALSRRDTEIPCKDCIKSVSSKYPDAIEVKILLQSFERPGRRGVNTKLK